MGDSLRHDDDDDDERVPLLTELPDTSDHDDNDNNGNYDDDCECESFELATIIFRDDKAEKKSILFLKKFNTFKLEAGSAASGAATIRVEQRSQDPPATPAGTNDGECGTSNYIIVSTFLCL